MLVVVLLNLRGLDEHSTAALVVGNGLLLVQTFAIALIVITQKKVLRTYPACTVAAWSYGLGTVLTSVGALSYYGVHTDVWLMEAGEGQDGYWAWAALVYAILIPTTCAHSLSTWANTQLVQSFPPSSLLFLPLFLLLISLFDHSFWLSAHSLPQCSPLSPPFNPLSPHS